MSKTTRRTFLKATAAAPVLMMAGRAPAAAPGASGALAPEETTSRIQKHRTAEVTLTVTGADGKPAADKAVTVEMVRHRFLFGCNIFKLRPEDASDDQKAYQKRFEELLNYATLPFYWGAFEREEGKPDTDRLRAMAQWCRDHGIHTKGHPLCWHQVDPKWLAGKSLDDVKALQLGRITRDVKAFAGLIDRWDVVNEAVVMPTYRIETNPIAQLCKKLTPLELIKETFAAARAAGPKATLLLNDFDTSAKYEALIKDCLAAGVPIDVIGIQSHQHGSFWGGQRAYDVCERFARFGKPLHFTETTIISGEKKANMDWQGRYTDWPSTPEGEARQAQQVAEFYRTLFSHPAVHGITWWDFSDAGAWLGAPSGFLRKDMSPKPAYEALMKMVKGEWWTAPATLKTDGEGKVKFRGFLGSYSVACGPARGTVDLDQAGAASLAVQVK